MMEPQVAPRTRRRGRPARTGWIIGVALLTFLAGILVSGYLTGPREVPLWDTLWLRAYLDRPIDTAAPGNGFWITGYYVDYDTSSLAVVRSQAANLDQVVIFGYGFDQQGRLSGKDHQLVKGLTGSAKRVLLFGNLTDGGFNAETAHAILTDLAVQDRTVQAILEKSLELEAGGVQIDFENIPGEDREAYTAFLRRLKEELADHGITLSVAAAAKTSDARSGWGGATDYAAVGQIVDQFYIMAYDEHWQGGEPGPVASLDWVEEVVRYAIGVIPSQKIVLGVPSYGYDWPADRSAAARAYGYTRMDQRMSELGATVEWDPITAENVAAYLDSEGERVAWYPDERSLDAKMRLAYQYNLKGIALWRLGFEPEGWWGAMNAFRENPVK